MYKIIGGDQKEYGPATDDEMRRWIAEGRLGGQSLVQAEGSGQWRPLSTYPEFAEALQTQLRSAPEGGAAETPPNAAGWTAEILARKPVVQMDLCLARSWELLRDNFGLFFGASFLVWLAEMVCQFNLVTFTVYSVMQGVFYGGLSLVFLNRLRGRPAVVGDAFSGFRVAFNQLLLAGFISGLLTWAAWICCLILPGIYLFVAWIFCLPLVADKRLEFWSAMELSRKVVTRVWFEIFALLLLAFLPVLLLNLFIQVKLSLAMIPALQGVFASSVPDVAHILEAFKQAQTAARISPGLLLAKSFLFLFNLPFAIGALMYAYENLFGARTAPTP